MGSVILILIILSIFSCLLASFLPLYIAYLYVGFNPVSDYKSCILA